MPVQMQNRCCGKEVRKFSFTRGGLKALTAKKQLRTRPASLLLTSRSLEGSGRPSGRNLWSGAAGNGPGARPSHRRRRQHSCRADRSRQTTAGRQKLNCHFGEASFFRIPSRPGKARPTRMLCQTAVTKGLTRRETRPVAAKGPRRPKRRSRGLVIAVARTPRSTEMWPTRLI